MKKTYTKKQLKLMISEAFHSENSIVIDNPSESNIESYIEDLKNAWKSISIQSGNRKLQNFKSSAEFALGDLIDQYDSRSEGFGIAFIVDAYDNEAVAGTTYIDFGNGIGCGTALVSLAKGCGKQLLKHMEKKFPNGFVCCPISSEVSKYYKSILKFDDIKKDEFIITANANDNVKKVFADLGPRIEGLSDNDIKELKNKLNISRKTYTKKQIQEAIAYWKKCLRKLDERRLDRLNESVSHDILEKVT